MNWILLASCSCEDQTNPEALNIRGSDEIDEEAGRGERTQAKDFGAAGAQANRGGYRPDMVCMISLKWRGTICRLL